MYDCERYSQSFPFHGVPINMIAEASEDDLRHLEAELHNDFPNIEKLCFLFLVFELRENMSQSKVFLFRWANSQGWNAELKNGLKQLNQFHLIRHPQFSNGLKLSMGGVADNHPCDSGIEAIPSFRDEGYAYLIKDLRSDNDAEYSPQQTERFLRAVSETFDLPQKEPQSKKLSENWKSWCDILSNLSDHLLDKEGNKAKTAFAFPLVTKGSHPIAHVVFGTSYSIRDRERLNFLKNIHHWCSYRQLVSLLHAEKARMYQRVLQHVRHESGMVITLLNDIHEKRRTTTIETQRKKYEKLAEQVLPLSRTILKVWGKDADNQDKLGIAELLNEAIQDAAQAACIKHLKANWVVELYREADPERLVQDSTRLIEEFTTAHTARKDLILKRQYYSDIRRVLFALIRNAQEHSFNFFRNTKATTSKLVVVSVNFNNHSQRAEFCIDNIYKETDSFSVDSDSAKVDSNSAKTEKIKIGTREVVDYCLLPLGGEVTAWGSDNQVWKCKFTVPSTVFEMRIKNA